MAFGKRVEKALDNTTVMGVRRMDPVLLRGMRAEVPGSDPATAPNIAVVTRADNAMIVAADVCPKCEANPISHRRGQGDGKQRVNKAIGVVATAKTVEKGKTTIVYRDAVLCAPVKTGEARECVKHQVAKVAAKAAKAKL